MIMASLFIVDADPTRDAKAIAVKMPGTLPRLGSLASVPAGLAVALVVFVSGYWGLHEAFYGNRSSARQPVDMSTHSHSTEYPYGPEMPQGAPHNHH